MLMCCLSCAKADSCEQADRVEDYCINHEERPMTNADRIRQMTDEELADWIAQYERCVEHKRKCDSQCYLCWLDWLKQEADT